jgi:spermidine synthase
MVSDSNLLISSKSDDTLRKYKLIASLLIIVFFFSGMCGLIYEVVWQKMLELVFGISTYSTTIILASFMGGLALGSYFFGKFIDRFSQPLKTYAALEIGIGLFALSTPWLFTNLTDLFVFIHKYLNTNLLAINIIKFILSFIVLLFPTFLMGGTIPVIIKFFVPRLDKMGSRIGLIYGSNVLGSVLGSFLAGFILISAFGKQHTIYYAAFINIGIGIFVFLMNRYAKIFQNVENVYKLAKQSALKTKSGLGKKKIKQSTDKGAINSGELVVFPSYLLILILITAGISGFCALAFEVLWTRTLIMFLRTSIYAFPTMLTTFLFGMGTGSLILSRFIDNTKRALIVLGVIQGLIGVIALFTIVEFTTINNLILSVWTKHGQGWLPSTGVGFAVSAIIMFIPAMFFGLSIPLVSKLYTRGLNLLGKSVGSIYSVNSVGSVLGAVVAGFIVIPLIGITKGIAVIALINILLGTILIFYNPYITRNLKLGIATSFAGVVFISLIVIPWKQPLGSYSFNFAEARAGGEILFYKEGIGGTASVTQRIPDRYTSKMDKQIEVNGVSVAGNERMLRTTQKFQGHVPLLLFKALTGKDPEYAFILGFGTGESSNCILKHDIKRLDCAELVEVEIEAAGTFSDINNSILQQEGFNLIINDARNVLLSASTTYDVIESDAVHPNIAYNTYTKEYYELCKQRLSEDGMISTWIPLFHLNADNLKILLHTINSVFPYVSIWFTTNFNNKHAILIGSKKKFSIDVRKLSEAMNEPAIKASLGEVDLDNLESIITAFVADETTIASRVQDYPVNTDDNLILPNNIPKTSIGEETISGNLQFFSSLGIPEFSSHFKNIPDTGNLKQNIKDYFAAREYIYDGLGHFFDRKPESAVKSYKLALEKNPQNQDIKYLLTTAQFYLYYRYVDAMYNQKRYPEALQMLDKLMLLKPENMWINNYMGVIQMRIGNVPLALEYLKKASSIAPDFYLIHYHLAVAYAREKDFLKAQEEIEKAIELNPPEESRKEFRAFQRRLVSSVNR